MSKIGARQLGENPPLYYHLRDAWKGLNDDDDDKEEEER